MSSFDQAVALMEPISAAEARNRIAAQEKFILFIGRPTCPFCRRFAPKLGQAVQETGAAVAYLNSEDMSQIEDIQALRNRYGVATVPGLLVSQNGSVKVVCDSSLTPEDIKDFMG
ncbi:thioredoxin family protein [Streptococcus tangpeifui]|uniref:thioredoxin family protein n=1 Tax=Streptococcus tangpeifui TaxID=2709400 RepID=UPI0013ED0824|nr:thioredoxin family protein [Streptococcus sp. ZJ1593]